MIVTDLDGTLLRDDKTISTRTLSALKLCREKGLKIAYATARGHSSTILAPSEHFDGCVRINGANAFIGDTLIYERLMQTESVRGLLVAAENAGVMIVVESGSKHYANFDVTEKWSWITHYEPADFNVLDIQTEKIYAVIDSPEDADVIRNHLSDDLYLYVSRDNFAMVMHNEAIKSKAVEALAAHWDIELNEVVAFGDDTNDIDMLEHCGIGVAMENALDEVKAAADQICGTNEDDGIAKWLEENVLREAGCGESDSR